MKIKSLLAAVSMVAMTAGSAHAIEIDYNATSDFISAIANELDLPTTPLAGTVVLDIELSSGGDYSNGTLHDVTVTLPAGTTFGSAVTGVDIEAIDNSGPTGFGNGNVLSGGAAGGSTVTFQINTASADVDNFQVSLPVEVAACPTAGINATVRITGGNFVENDSAGGTTNDGTFFAMGCGSTLDGVVASDETVSDTLISLGAPTYAELKEGAVAVASGTPSKIGDITYSIDGDYAVDEIGTLMVQADVTSIAHTITLPGNTTNGLILTSSAGVVTGGPVTWTLTLTGTDALPAVPVASAVTAGATIDLFVETQGIVPPATAEDLIPTMQPAVSAATVTFAGTPSPDFIANEAGATGNLDRLQREGQDFGFFDWNGSNGNGTLTVYRITGLTGPTIMNVTIENSNADGTYTTTVSPDATGEAVITSLNMGGTLPAGVVRFDAQLNFETATALDVDRLMSRGGIITSFGDGANGDPAGTNQPGSDGDQNRNSE